MGSMIHLAIGQFEIDWGKNNVFTMHGPLFQRDDVKTAPYRYVDWPDGSPVVESKEAAVRPLHRVVGRLELLGFTLDGCRRAYDELAASIGRREPPMSFDLLAELLRTLDVDEIAAAYHGDYDLGEFFATEIYDRLNLDAHGFDRRDAQHKLGAFMENVHPYVLLRLLAENPETAARDLIWAFADVVEGGWVTRQELLATLGAERRFLIVTEGSSDAAILKRALSLVKPDVSDFFYFVDMEEGYPFTGTGNLHKFCHGLSSIAIENRVIAVYDNDAEGVAKFRETSGLRLPANIRAMKLPDHHSFRLFPTIGPQGIGPADINGCAAALECYLDLEWGAESPPAVRWTSYSPSSDAYQGELVNKQVYAKRFLNLRQPVVGYDLSKLDAVLGELLSTCVDIATQQYRRPTELGVIGLPGD